MAGYLFSLDSTESLQSYATNGAYATKLSTPKKHWNPPQEGTFADYATMRAGDNVYFFIKRKIYGIGELVNVGKDCKYCNFPGATRPLPVEYNEIRDSLLWDEGEFSKDQRWVCFFKPAPSFFSLGVDMDDVLSSKPSAFKMLRAFWKLSFIKFDDEENQAFKDVILKLNQEHLDAIGDAAVFDRHYRELHGHVVEKVSGEEYNLDVTPILSECANGDKLGHEMALEAGLLFALANNDREVESVFGQWDYLSHQVVASPLKPIDYMDKMDVFGYAYITGYDPTKSKYLVAELKKDGASEADVEQLLKYVDWVTNEYCFGDYSMINAFLVAYDFPQAVMEHKENVAVRKYTVGMRPAYSREWKNLKLVKYSYREADSNLVFDLVL